MVPKGNCEWDCRQLVHGVLDSDTNFRHEFFNCESTFGGPIVCSSDALDICDGLVSYENVYSCLEWYPPLGNNMVNPFDSPDTTTTADDSDNNLSGLPSPIGYCDSSETIITSTFFNSEDEGLDPPSLGMMIHHFDQDHSSIVGSGCIEKSKGDSTMPIHSSPKNANKISVVESSIGPCEEPVKNVEGNDHRHANEEMANIDSSLVQEPMVKQRKSGGCMPSPKRKKGLYLLEEQEDLKNEGLGNNVSKLLDVDLDKIKEKLNYRLPSDIPYEDLVGIQSYEYLMYVNAIKSMGSWNDAQENAYKKQKRRIKNRESAQHSRLRRHENIKDLEIQVQSLKEQCDEYKTRYMTLSTEFEEMNQQLKYLKEKTKSIHGIDLDSLLIEQKKVDQPQEGRNISASKRVPADDDDKTSHIQGSSSTQTKTALLCMVLCVIMIGAFTSDSKIIPSLIMPYGTTVNSAVGGNGLLLRPASYQKVLDITIYRLLIDDWIEFLMMDNGWSHGIKGGHGILDMTSIDSSDGPCNVGADTYYDRSPQVKDVVDGDGIDSERRYSDGRDCGLVSSLCRYGLESTLSVFQSMSQSLIELDVATNISFWIKYIYGRLGGEGYPNV